MTEKLKWCWKKKNVELIESGKNLADAFIKKAERSLEEINNSKYQESKISHAYYTMYDALYALLQRIGIKSEVHACTFELARVFLSDHLETEEIDYIEKSLKTRIDATYYVNKDISDEAADEMFEKSPEILAKCKAALKKITEEKVKEVRDELEKIE